MEQTYAIEFDEESGCYKIVLLNPDHTVEVLGQQWVDSGEAEEDISKIMIWVSKWNEENS